MASETFDTTLVVKVAPDRQAAACSERAGTLTVLIGADVGAMYSLTGPVMLGRGAEAQVSLDDDGISRRHCRIVRGAGLYELEDLGSTNGTYVDYDRVQGRIELQDGARIQIGNSVLRFALQDRLEQETSRRMYEMAVRDGLTSAYNRRYFDERIESEFAFAVRHGSALCVLLIDIDHFKRINDTHGHHGGDEVLRRMICRAPERRSRGGRRGPLRRGRVRSHRARYRRHRCAHVCRTRPSDGRARAH